MILRPRLASRKTYAALISKKKVVAPSNMVLRPREAYRHRTLVAKRHVRNKHERKPQVFSLISLENELTLQKSGMESQQKPVFRPTWHLKSGYFSHQVDTNAMKQQNMTTGNIRPIRRVSDASTVQTFQ